jgi:uncharacterized RDD family membrane protein YckC
MSMDGPNEGGASPAPSEGGGQWSAPAVQRVPGAAGLIYADVPNRAVAYIIDAIILGVIGLIVGAIIGSILPTATVNPNATDFSNLVTINYAAVLVTAVISTAINGVYFIYTWTGMRGSPGQKLLGMQVGNFPDGATLTMEQAIRRWIFLGAPFGIAGALVPIPALGILLALAALAYFIFLLVTTAQSPTKQGFHDKQVNSVVVKAARAVA